MDAGNHCPDVSEFILSGDFQGDSQVNVALAGETFVIHLLPPDCNFAQRGYPGATLLAPLIHEKERGPNTQIAFDSHDALEVSIRIITTHSSLE